MAEAVQLEPDLVGAYRILERLGRGGMGIVYRAAHNRTGELAALKTVLVPSGRHLAAIRREIQALAQIEHPGVVRILDEGVDSSGLPWYAMQLLNGMTLREYRFASQAATPIRDRYWAMNLSTRATRSAPVLGPDTPPIAEQLPPGAPISEALLPSILGVFRKLCAPLAFVHGEGLVHCDLKPENIFLCYDGRPVLVDFGLISRFGSGMHREVLDVDLFMGTAEYMAPEQWEGKPVDARTDLYALGCILFEVLTGQPPFVGDRSTMYRAHLLRDPPSAREFAPHLPDDIDELLEGLLAKRPRDRIGHADEVARRLAALGAEGPRDVGPTPRPYLFRPSFAGRGNATNEVVGLLSGAGEGGRLVLLEGESGVGKTRLAMEAARMARRGGIQVLTGECSATGQTVLHPFRALLLHLADRVREEGPTSFDTLLNGRARILARVEPEVGRLPQAEHLPKLVTLSAEAERARMLSALTMTLAALGREKRTFLVIDDLQWADELTQELLFHLVERPDAWGNVILLGTTRSESMPSRIRTLATRDDVGYVRLARLSPGSVEAIASDMLGFPPPRDFSDFLTRQTSGNPFFVAEYLRAAMTRGLLVRDRTGKWSLAARGRSFDELGLPKTLVDLLSLRLDTLGSEARTYLDAAAVIGRVVDADLVQKAAGLSERGARLAVEELLRKQIFEESSRGFLRFAHDKLREASYERLDEPHRQHLHRRAAETIEAHVVEPTSSALAYHWEQAGHVDRAIVHLEAAASDAIVAGAHQEATSFLRRILDHVERPGADRTARRRTARWHRQLGDAHLVGGDLAEARSNAERALDLLGHAAPITTGGWGTRLASELTRQLAHRALPPASYEEPENRETLSEATLASGTLARIAFFENDPIRIVGSAFWSINLAERAGSFVEAARNYSGLGWVFGTAGLHRVADNYFARARKTGLDGKDWAGLIFSLTSEAVYRIGRGQWPQAIEVLQACEQPLSITGDPQAKELVETLRGHPEFFAGRFDDAMARHRFVLDSARNRRNVQHEAWSLYCSARAALALGQNDEAIEDLEMAASLIETQTDQMSEITCHGLLASARCRVGDLDGAQTAADRAKTGIGTTAPTVFLTLHGYEGIAEVAVTRVIGVAPLDRKALVKEAKRAVGQLERAAKTFAVGVPTAALWRARLSRILGDTDRAQKAIRAGAAVAGALNMPRHLDDLQKELGSLKDAVRGAPPA